MKIQKTLAVASALLTLPLHAQVYNFDYTGSPRSIPDGNATGLPISETISGAGASISSIKVTVNITGDFNGDIYLDLRHGSDLSVLINRPGTSGSDPFGYDDHGFNITLSDSAAHDIHTYRDFTTPGAGLQLTGEWQPDSNPTALSVFQGLNPNGQWTLFAADLQNGGNSQIQSWGMELTVVPEPQYLALAAGLALLGFGIVRKKAMSS